MAKDMFAMLMTISVLIFCNASYGCPLLLEGRVPPRPRVDGVEAVPPEKPFSGKDFEHYYFSVSSHGLLDKWIVRLRKETTA